MATETEAPERIRVHSSVLFQLDEDGEPFTAEYIGTEEEDGTGFVVEYVRADAAPREQGLREALEKIRDGADNQFICACDHDNENCCVKVDEYCPYCIASVALATRAVLATEEVK